MIIFKIVFWTSLFIIFFSNIGYQTSLIILDKFYKKDNIKDYKNRPTVTIMVVAHNEEKVIVDKLKNLLSINYPKSKLEILVASDNSTDQTDFLVGNFIQQHPEEKIRLFKVKQRKGKTNAQNEAQKTVNSEILVMTDANAMLDKNSITELVSSFSSENISYVTGKLVYINDDDSHTSSNESLYWKLDLLIREIESKIQTITAGNGAIYAVRNDCYHDFEPIKSHDSSMPLFYSLNSQKAIANHEAIAFEKAGETNADEFKRKVRMNRVLLNNILPTVKILNVFKYKWFTYFYLGHRSSRYLLWLAHVMLLFSNIILAFNSLFFQVILAPHLLIYVVSIIGFYYNYSSFILKTISYYMMTIFAQLVGVKNILTGQNKPFWEKAESTR